MDQNGDRLSESDDALLIPEPESETEPSPGSIDDELLPLDTVTETRSVRPVENESHTDRPLGECSCRWCRQRVGVERPRHRRRSHRSRWRLRHCQMKCKDSNLPAAACSAIAVVLFCGAMAEPRWFHFHGGGCQTYKTHELITSLGLTKFFHAGRFLPNTGTDIHFLYEYGNSYNLSDVLVNCVTLEIVQYMRMIIALCFIGLAFAMAQFLLDVVGPTFKYLRPLHRNAFFSIFTVLTCVAIHGLSYWITELIKILQRKTRMHTGSTVHVSFGVSFYLIAAAGVVSILATAFNLLRCRWDSQNNREHMFGNYEGIDFGPEFGPHVSETCVSLAPPAYTP